MGFITALTLDGKTLCDCPERPYIKLHGPSPFSMYTVAMVVRLLIVAQLLSYQLLTMPCQACPMATAGAGECSASGCCSSDAESGSGGGCCGGHEAPSAEAACCAEEEEATSSCCEEDVAPVCCSESVQPSCGEDSETESAIASLEPVMSSDGCKCCPISTPCDRCVALNADRPPHARTHTEISGSAVIAFVTVDAQIIHAVATCLHPPDVGHKASVQSLQCSWLN